MTKRKAAHIIRSLFKRLYKHSRKMKKDFSEDAIHDFRVDFKKLRAFLRMLALKAAQPDTVRLPRSLKKLYRVAGEIRDRQLCIKRIREDKEQRKGASKKLHALKKEIKELSGKDVFLSKNEFDKMEDDIIKHIPAVVAITAIHDFIHQKTDAIDGIVARKRYSDDDLHSIRKNLKDITYVGAIATSDLKTRMIFPFWNKAGLNKADDMTHRLGLFNDSGTALSFLPASEIKQAELPERESLGCIRKQWLARRRKLRKDVLERIPGLKSDTAPGN